jgi:hypothetical protein
MIEVGRERDKRFIASALHLFDDGSHGIPHVGGLIAPGLNESLEP